MSEQEDNKKNNTRLQMAKYVSEAEKRGKFLKVSLISLGIVIANIAIIFLIIMCINRFNTNVYKNIYFMSSDLSNMTEAQVVEYLTNKATSYDENSEVNIYQDEKNIYSVKSNDIKFELDVEKTAKKVLEYGRTGNAIKDNFNIIKALVKPANVEPEYKYDTEALDNTVKNIDLTVENRFVDDTYSVDEKTNKLMIVTGKTGKTVNYDEVKNDIVQLLGNNAKTKYKLNVITKKPDKIDVQKVYQNVKRDAKDAYVDQNATPVKYVSEVIGLDFNVNELEQLLAKPENTEEGKTIEFALKVTEPKVKLSDITYTLYKDKLDGYTTYFDPTQKNRSNNISIALGYLNGVIIMPGEVFSYNKIIGDTTAAKGYLPASTFKGGTIVQEMGGGICQTVSTLYDVALRSNLQIIERHQHGLPVGYVKPSLDATVYGDVLDLKFKNTRAYPIKIVTSFSPSGSMNISLYGTKEANEYDIELTSKYLYTIPYTIQYIYDNTMLSGQQVVISNGANGYASEGYITKKLGGKIISSTLLSKDIYKAQQRVVKVGTKANEQVQTPPPDNTGEVGIY